MLVKLTKLTLARILPGLESAFLKSTTLNTESYQVCKSEFKRILIDLTAKLAPHQSEIPKEFHILLSMVEDVDHLSFAQFKRKYTLNKAYNDLPICHCLMRALNKNLYTQPFYDRMETFESHHRFTRLAALFNAKPVPRSELLDDLLKLKIKKQSNTGRPVDMRLINHYEFYDFIKQHIEKFTNSRIVVIVQNNIHYTTLDIAFDPESPTPNCIIMDAAEDERTKEYIEILSKFDANITMLGTPTHHQPLQIESGPCGFYAYRHLCKSSEEPKFHEVLNALPSSCEDGVKYVAWTTLPENLTKYAQNPDLQQNDTCTIDDYIHKQEKKWQGSQNTIGLS